ncbi:MAG TPA: hypothetical protein VMN39_05960 [Longimicrobiaceae bacterium]|nr:hypothetical protein [Longimicrobiaceae bacterium]
MRVLYALNCEHAEARADGRLDVHGVFHQLYAPGFPAKQDRMVLAIAVEWNAEGEGRREFRIDLVDPSESPCLTISGHTDISPHTRGEPPPQTRLILPMEEVVFPQAGTYLFELDVGEEKVKVAPLHLVEHREPE